MTRTISIGNVNSVAIGLDMEITREEYLPVASIRISDLIVTDDIENFTKGIDMRNVSIGDELASATFVRQAGDDVVEVTLKKMDQTIVQKYKVDELAIALRFITMDENE